MLLKLYKWFNKDKTVLIFDRNHLPIECDTITVNGLTATFGQEPIVYVTDDIMLDVKTFEANHVSKFNKQAQLIIINRGSDFKKIQ